MARSSARKELTKLALPIVATNATLAVMQITDGLIVGRLGVKELAAITPAGVLIFLLASFGYSFFSCVTTFASQSGGAGRAAEGARFAWQSLYLSVVFGAAAVVVLWPLAPWVFHAFTGNQALLDLEVTYFRYGLLTVPPEFIATALSAYFFGVARPWVVCLLSVIGIAANVFFSIGLVFGQFGLPELGFAGAPIGTLLATSLNAILLFAVFVGRRERQLRSSTDARFCAERTGKLLRVGLPAGGQGALDTFSWGVILTWLISKFPDEQLAASSALIRCLQLSFLPAEGVGAALVAKVGDSIGAGDPEGAKTYARVSFSMMALYMGSVGLLLWIFREPVMGLFTENSEVVAAGAAAMIFVSAFQVFDAMNINYLHALQGAGDTFWTCVVNALLSVVVLLGGGLAVIHWFYGWGATGIWAVATVYVVLQGLLFRFRWSAARWQGIGKLA